MDHRYRRREQHEVERLLDDLRRLVGEGNHAEAERLRWRLATVVRASRPVAQAG